MKQSSKLFKFVGLLLVVGLLFAALPAGQVKAATGPEVVYDSLLTTLPPNVPSQGFQATQTAELGDYIRLTKANTRLSTATVTMSTWAKLSEYPS
ncbi:MAG TPA: hypothetical protein VLR89_00760, partial [Anaerolineaceae bacterium]|nr:hypothetical protein [Anaerolineaceae bacterium]